MDYIPKDALVIIDESHVTIPQIQGMYRGDRSRKETLVEFGFRLPSALDNRPLMFEEFQKRVESGGLRLRHARPLTSSPRAKGHVVEQIVRPTGLMDPVIEVKPARNQVDALLEEVKKVVADKERVLITTLTKRFAEDLTDFLLDAGIKTKYLHSEVDTLERIAIVRDLRLGKFDVLVGVNLLREGLDLPEVSLVAILDADKEGFLRSETSLIQTCGRAARNINGRVIMFADKITDSMRRTIDETDQKAQGPDGIQRGPRHHPRRHQERDRRHPFVHIREGLLHGRRGRVRGAGRGPEEAVEDGEEAEEGHKRGGEEVGLREGGPAAGQARQARADGAGDIKAISSIL